MSHLVSDDVGLREIAWRAKSPIQFVEEAHIDVDLSIARAVERARGRGGKTARRIDLVTEHHQPRRLITEPGIAKDGGPGILGITEDARDQPACFVARWS